MTQERHGVYPTQSDNDEHPHPTISQDKRTICVFTNYLPITDKLYGDPTGYLLVAISVYLLYTIMIQIQFMFKA